MKILVAIKRVPAPEQRVSIGPNGRIDESVLSFTINPFDAIALEEALRIRERGQQAIEVLAISIGRDAAGAFERGAASSGNASHRLLLCK